MTTSSAIQDFISQKNIAVVGVSSEGKGFGARVFRNLRAKGYHVLAVNPKGGSLDGETLHTSLKSLPERVDGAVLVVPPPITEKVVADAKAAGIPRIWMQEGAESDAAIDFCEDNQISVVHGVCVMVESDAGRSNPPTH